MFGKEMGDFVPRFGVTGNADGTVNIDIDDLREEFAGESKVADVAAIPVSLEAFHDGEKEFVGELLDVAWPCSKWVQDLFAGCQS